MNCPKKIQFLHVSLEEITNLCMLGFVVYLSYVALIYVLFKKKNCSPVLHVKGEGFFICKRNSKCKFGKDQNEVEAKTTSLDQLSFTLLYLPIYFMSVCLSSSVICLLSSLVFLANFNN